MERGRRDDACTTPPRGEPLRVACVMYVSSVLMSTAEKPPSSRRAAHQPARGGTLPAAQQLAQLDKMPAQEQQVHSILHQLYPVPCTSAMYCRLGINGLAFPSHCPRAQTMTSRTTVSDALSTPAVEVMSVKESMASQSSLPLTLIHWQAQLPS